MRKNNHPIILATILAIAFLATKPALAGKYANVCEVLLEDTFFEETFTEQLVKCQLPKKRLAKWAYCFALPHCCVPMACKTDPVCASIKVVEDIKKVRNILKEKGEINCSFRFINSREFLDKLLMYALENGIDLLTGGFENEVMELVNANLDVLEAQAVRPSAEVRELMKAYIKPWYNGGDYGFSYQDLDNIKIVPDLHPLARAWLRDMDGITLGPVIVVKLEHFRRLTSHPQLEWYDLLTGSHAQLSESLDLLAHELVHVKQQREEGQNDFFKNYLVNVVYSGGYGHDPYEQEAYSFAAEMAENWGGNFCEAVYEVHNIKIDLYDLNRSHITCTKKYGLGFEYLEDFQQVVTEPYISFDGAVSLCNEQYTRQSGVRSDCLYDGKPIGYSLYWNHERVGYAPFWSRTQGVNNCNQNSTNASNRDVDCTFNGENMGYELFHNGVRVAFEPAWDRSHAVANCARNREIFPDKEVDCTFDGHGLGYEGYIDDVRVRAWANIEREGAARSCYALMMQNPNKQVFCFYDGESIGYVGLVDGEVTEIGPVANRDNAVKRCLALQASNVGRNVFCTHQGESLGYELFWNRKRVGYGPDWTIADAAKNCRWNLKTNGNDYHIDCKFDGERIPIIFNFFYEVPTLSF